MKLYFLLPQFERKNNFFGQLHHFIFSHLAVSFIFNINLLNKSINANKVQQVYTFFFLT